MVDDEVHVEDQHDWVSFSLSVAPGTHQVTAESDNGATLSESFEVPGDETHYAVIQPLGRARSAGLTWVVQQEPVGFA